MVISFGSTVAGGAAGGAAGDADGADGADGADDADDANDTVSSAGGWFWFAAFVVSLCGGL